MLFRYVKKNTRGHSLYRPYSNDVPVYLHDQPKPVIDAARHKISLAEEIPASRVKTTGSNGEFRVKSQDADKRWYLVSFGNDIDKPFCECLSWLRNHFPSKHFFAIFRHFPEWGWEKLPQQYRNSPLLTLDEPIIGISTKPVAEPLDLPESMSISDNIQEESTLPYHVEYMKLPQKKGSPKAVGSACRELLSEIKQITFLIDDLRELETLKANMQNIHLRLKKVVPSDNGLQVERGGKKKNKKRKLQTQDEPLRKQFREIPKASKRKHIYSGRQGVKAAMMRKTLQVHVNVLKNQHEPVKAHQQAANCSKVTTTEAVTKVTEAPAKRGGATIQHQLPPEYL